MLTVERFGTDIIEVWDLLADDGPYKAEAEVAGFNSATTELFVTPGFMDLFVFGKVGKPEEPQSTEHYVTAVVLVQLLHELAMAMQADGTGSIQEGQKGSGIVGANVAGVRGQGAPFAFHLDATAGGKKDVRLYLTTLEEALDSGVVTHDMLIDCANVVADIMGVPRIDADENE